jgi:hypothetical protein
MAVGVPLPPIETAVGSYRHFKLRQEPNLEATSANVESDYFFGKIKYIYIYI